MLICLRKHSDTQESGKAEQAHRSGRSAGSTGCRKMEREGREMKMAECDVDLCEVREVHQEKVSEITAKMPEEDELYDLAELFKVFGDSTRMRILFALFEADICVCDLAQALGMTQSAVSHQLRILRQARLVSSRREGKQVIYFLTDEHVRTIIDKGREHIEED